MTADEVGEPYTQLASLGVEIWVDGGWGVDALCEGISNPLILIQGQAPRGKSPEVPGTRVTNYMPEEVHCP